MTVKEASMKDTTYQMYLDVWVSNFTFRPILDAVHIEYVVLYIRRKKDGKEGKLVIDAQEKVRYHTEYVFYSTSTFYKVQSFPFA